MRQPSNTLALYLLGHCFERLGHQAQAVEFYQDCIKFNSYLQLPAQRLGAIYFKEGRLDETIAQYEPLKEHYPDDISTLVTLGHLYIAADQYAKAVETFNTAILIHPGQLHVARRFHRRADLITGSFRRPWTRSDVLLTDEPERPDLIAKQADILSMMGKHQRRDRPVPAGAADLSGFPGGHDQAGDLFPEDARRTARRPAVQPGHRDQRQDRGGLHGPGGRTEAGRQAAEAMQHPVAGRARSSRTAHSCSPRRPS